MKHIFETWRTDETSHWHECTVCGAKGAVNEHVLKTDASGRTYCTLCNYVISEGGLRGDANGDGRLRGDANGDGRVFTDDVIYVLNHFIFGESFYPAKQSLDYTGDGKVDQNDVIRLLNHIFFDPDFYPIV